MKKIDKRDLNLYLSIAGFIVLFYVICTNFGEYLFGSTVDWNAQHYKIPEYLRQQFYETGNLFPDFAPNLGAGQNIYNFSYYGLLNPVILLSYFLPFVPMHIYISISTLILVYISVILLFKWLSGKVARNIAEFTSFIFLLSTPLLFHAHRHVMFVNYMPFLIMAFIAVDRYFNQGKKLLLPISVLLICLTSYFFSVGAMIAIVLYGVYVYAHTTDKLKIKDFMKDGTRFVLWILLGIAMASVPLIPTFNALLTGRTEVEGTISLIKLLMPISPINSLCYGTYSLGLTIISLFALIYCTIKLKRENRFLGIALIIIVTIPIFQYLLNAGMYVRAKPLIPLLPLYVLLLAVSLNDVFKEGKISKACILVFAFVGVCCAILNTSGKLLLFDFTLTLLSFIIFNVFKRAKKIIFIAAIVVASLSFVLANTQENLVQSNAIQEESRSEPLIELALENDDGYYRISDKSKGLDIANKTFSANHLVSSIYSSLSNQWYQAFFYDHIGNNIPSRSRGQIQNPDNILFDIYMGNKYIICSETDRLGLEIVSEQNGLFLCQNKDALPMAYLSSRTMSREQFNKLEYPYNAEALLNYVIVDGAEWREYKSKINEIDLKYTIAKQDGLSIEYTTDEEITIHTQKGGTLTLDLADKLEDRLLFISFDLAQTNEASIGDHIIAINGVTNRLSHKGWTYNNKNYTFEYTLSDPSTGQLEIVFAPGTYKITNIKTYAAYYEDFVSEMNNVTPMKFDAEKTKGDVIEGTINAENAGYFTISVPYDKGLTVYVNGEKVDYEQVNTAFIGVKLSAGEHDIRIVYRAPFKIISIIISILAFSALFGIAYVQLVNSKKQKSSVPKAEISEEEVENER